MGKTDPRAYVLGVLKKETARDKQRLVGASQISNQCTRCLADELLGKAPAQGRYWLGAKIGTAIHEYLEHNAPGGVHTEVRLTLGEIPGYGVVKSTSDLYLPQTKTVVDFKTTTRSKLKLIRNYLEFDRPDTDTQHKVQGYLNQVMLYGMGLTHPVEHVSLVFIARDGSGDEDIWEYTIPYDEDRALQVWNRVVRLWKWLQDGGDPNELTEADGCYVCNQIRPYAKEAQDDEL